MSKQVFEIGEGRNTAAGIVQRKAAAGALDLVDQAQRVDDVGDGGGFGDPEPDAAAGQAMGLQLA